MEETIDLKNVFKMMWEKKLIIIITTMIAILLGFIYSYRLVKPKYTAKVQIVLVQIDKNQEKKSNLGALTQSDVTINDKIIATYQKLLTNDDVLTQVIQNTQIVDITPAELKKSTTATVVSNTQILDIQVTNKNPEKAAILALEKAVEKEARPQTLRALGSLYLKTNNTDKAQEIKEKLDSLRSDRLTIKQNRLSNSSATTKKIEM